MQKLASFCRSKTGRSEDCEDDLVVTDDFACVVDGATSQSERTWNHKTGGQAAAQAIVQAVSNLQGDNEPFEAVNRMTAAVSQLYIQAGCREEMERNPLDRASASCVVYSQHRRELWFVGDCQCLLVFDDGTIRLLENPKAVDRVTSQARSLFLQAELSRGASVDAIRKNDIGRAFIKPLLKRQRCFQNNPEQNDFCYWVIDGFPVPENAIKVENVPRSVSNLILASDGYPTLCSTLEETEEHLRRVISVDPLMIYSPCAGTKGVQSVNESFDDRTFLHIMT